MKVKLRCLAGLLLAMSSSSALSQTSSTSSGNDSPSTEFNQFLDPTEVFQVPPPTEIALGELFAEADFIAVVYDIADYETDDCVAKILRVKRMCGLRDSWDREGPQGPHILRNAWGGRFLIQVGRHSRDIFVSENFDFDAYYAPVLLAKAPFLLFGKSRPVTPEQAEQLDDNCPLEVWDGDGPKVPTGFEITTQTPVRPIQGLRGVFPLYDFQRLLDLRTEQGVSDDPEAGLSDYTFKYLIQTYEEPDATRLVRGVNQILEALSKDDQEKREALGALTESADPVTAAAAVYLLGMEPIPRFTSKNRVPLPVGP